MKFGALLCEVGEHMAATTTAALLWAALWTALAGPTHAQVAPSVSGILPAGTPDTSPRPSVVIVHGAFADGSDWSQVIAMLQSEGLKVTAVQLPLSSLAQDVEVTRRAIAHQSGNVVLVGHSWGGTVITQAGIDPKVVSLVYVAAFAPDVGQSVADLAAMFPAPSGSHHLLLDERGFVRLSDEGIRDHFAQDVAHEVSAVMAATQGPIQAKSFEQPVFAAAWAAKPCWFVVTAQDRMIAPELQSAMARRIGAWTIRVQSSHVPQRSHPAEVSAVILKAVVHGD